MKGDCQTHSDCDYFHCKGRCDLIEGKCSDDGVVNDNLQAICDNVFLGKSRFSNRMSRNLEKLCFPPQAVAASRACSSPDCSAPAT